MIPTVAVQISSSRTSIPLTPHYVMWVTWGEVESWVCVYKTNGWLHKKCPQTICCGFHKRQKMGHQKPVSIGRCFSSQRHRIKKPCVKECKEPFNYPNILLRSQREVVINWRLVLPSGNEVANETVDWKLIVWSVATATWSWVSCEFVGIVQSRRMLRSSYSDLFQCDDPSYVGRARFGIERPSLCVARAALTTGTGSGSSIRNITWP